jgi:phage shock protein A
MREVVPMAKEPDDLVLIHLREMRAEMAGIRSEIGNVKAEQGQRFDSIDKTLETLKFQMTYTYGADGIANMTGLHAEAKADDIIVRQKRTDERVEDLDRRLRRVEETSGA